MVPQYEDDYYYDDPVQPVKQSRNWMISLSLATILALIVIGETVGGLVTVNNRKHIEFGQGVTFTLPCDQDGITVKPVAEYKTYNTDRDFLFDSLFISGISDNCLNKLFQLKFYNLSGPPLIIGYKNINGGTRFDADAVRFLLSRKIIQQNSAFYAGLNWYTYPNATGIGNPPTPPSNLLCGGENNFTLTLDYDWSDKNPLPGCPTNNWLAHFQGFLNVPGTDDGNLFTVNFKFESYGNTELWIDGRKIVADNSTRSSLTSSSGSVPLRKGQSYLVDYWVFKPSGNSAAKLYWDLDASGNRTGSQAIIPDSALFTASQDLIEISPTEGTTDYTVESISTDSNNRSIKIVFPRPIEAGKLQFFTVETS